jgi:hypothetical protein
MPTKFAFSLLSRHHARVYKNRLVPDATINAVKEIYKVLDVVLPDYLLIPKSKECQ